jgi:hypothetical protein
VVADALEQIFAAGRLGADIAQLGRAVGVESAFLGFALAQALQSFLTM